MAAVVPVGVCRGASTAPVTPRSRSVDRAAWAERRPSTTTAATPAPAAASKAASQPASISTRSTRDPTTPSTWRRARDRPRPAARTGRARAPRPGPSCGDGRASARPPPPAPPRPPGPPPQARPWSPPSAASSAAVAAARSSAFRTSRSAPHGGAGLALLEAGHPGARAPSRSCCSRAAARAILGAGPAAGAIACSGSASACSDRSWPSTDALPAQPAVLAVQRRQRGGDLGPLGRAARRLLGFGQASSPASRAASASSVETTSTSAAASSAASTPRPRSRRTPCRPSGPLDQPLDAAQRVGQVLLPTRRQLGRRRGRLGVEHLQRRVQLALLLAAHVEVRRRRLAPARQLGHLRPRPGNAAPSAARRPPHRGSGPPRPGAPGAGSGAAPRGRGRPSRSRFSAVAASRRSARSRRRRCFSTPAASSMIARRSSGRAFEHRVELALADDHVLLAPDARVRQQLLDVEQAAGRAVDGVLAVARAEQRPRDRDLGQVDRQLPRGVVDGERDLGAPELRAATTCRRR